MSLHPHRVRNNRWRKIRRDIGLLEGQKARYAKYPRGQGWRTGHENPWHFSRENLYGLTSLNPKHKKGIGLIILLSLGILFVTDQALKNPAIGKSPIDPSTVLWADGLQSADLTGWNTNRANYVATQKFEVFGDANGPGIAVSKSPVDLSTVSGKELWLEFAFGIVAGTANNAEFGLFLTRNGTLPAVGPDANYNPANDANVAFYEKFNFQTTGPQILLNLLMQKDISASLSNSQYPGCQGGSGAGICFTVTTQPTATSAAPNNNNILELNYTGQSVSTSGGTPTGPGDGVNQITVGCCGGSAVWQRGAPWFNFQSTHYYVGFFTAKGAGNIVRWAAVTAGDWPNPNCVSDSMLICRFQRTTNFPGLVDTSGFFGPIIKALINLGVVMLNAALQFVAFITPGLTAGLSFLETFYTTLIDVIGNLIWPGSNLGTALASMLSAILNFMVNVVPSALGNVVAIFSRYVDGASVLLTWGAIPLKIALNVLLVGINTISFAMNLISMLTKIWGVLLFTFLVIFYFGDVGDYGLSGFQAWFETVKWLIFGLGIRPLFMILDYMIDIITAIIGFIPKPFVQMVAHKFPRLPIVDITGNPTWPSFDLEELRRGNIFSVGGFLIGTVALVWYETTSLPGSITALVPGVGTTLTNLNGLTNLSLLFVELFGFCVIFLLPGKMIHAVTGLAVNPPWGENLAFQTGRSVSVRGTSIRVQRKPKKHFQGRLEKKVAKLKGTMSEKEKEEAVSKAFAEAARKQQADIEVQKARETGERVAKEELKRREDERQRQKRIAQVGD